VKERQGGIEKATSFESAIEIIPEEVCEFALSTLEFELALLTVSHPEDFVVIPIMDGGGRVGAALADFCGLTLDPMKMSHYDNENKRVAKPECLMLPEIDKIIVDGKVRHIIISEGVVESEETVLESINIINNLVDEKSRKDGVNYPHPIPRTFGLISKVKGFPRIPNFTYPLSVHPDIWVHGMDVDNGQKGRELNNIMGVLSPFAKSIPQMPYFTTTRLYNKYFIAPPASKKC